MGTSVHEALAVAVQVDDHSIRVTLQDGRTISAPISWFPTLLNAAPEARSNWRLIGAGEGIHWPELDEDISVAGLLAGR
jgi:hypothetical protein